MKKNHEELEQQGEVPAKSRRKVVYTIVLAACALVLIAAITLTAVFVTRDNGVSIEQPVPDDDKDEQGEEDKPDEPDTPSDVEPVFSMPVQNAELGTTFTFWHNQTLNRYNLHTGIDFKAEAGTSVTAAYAGTVESITDTILEGGKVVLDHGNGLKTEYASIDVAAGLKVGDSVAQGQTIGSVSAAADAMGNEFAEGAHLHFEVIEDGASIDPVAYLDYDEK